jgi:hypothetical protein
MVLSSIGLPMNVEEVKGHPFYINFYNEPEPGLGFYEGDDYMILGDNEGSKIGIHIKTGNMYFLDAASSSSIQRRWMNSDIAKFLLFLKIFLSYRPLLVDAMEAEADEDKILEIVDNIEQQFNQVDSKALLDEESYWSVMLEQVKDGLSC